MKYKISVFSSFLEIRNININTIRYLHIITNHLEYQSNPITNIQVCLKIIFINV